MAGIFVYSDDANVLGELVRFAWDTGKPAYALAFSDQEVESIRAFGANRIYRIKGDSPLIESYSKALAAFLASEEAELFAVGLTPRGRDLAARVAGYLGCGMVSDALTLTCEEDGFKTEKMLYGGVAVMTETFTNLCVVTLSSGKYEALVATEESPVSVLELEADSRVKLVATAPIVKEGADLSVAERVVCVGLGMNKQEDLAIAEDLARALDAEIGCTRSVAEERKWLPAQQYIGISGAIIKPQLYLSMGISGQIQHVIGVRDARTIVAIDTNESAPIFKAADYGILGDMYEIVPLLTEALKKD